MMDIVWAYGANWPNNGEVDILEGANLAYTNIMSAHTADGCMLDPADSNLFSGNPQSLDCAVGTDNVGCGFTPPASDTSSYGDGFNAVGGGVYAMEWDSEYISIWHFPRGAIPADIEAKRPDPRKWGLPQSLFGGSKCNVDEYFNDMRIVLNIVSTTIMKRGTWTNDLSRTFAAIMAREPGEVLKLVELSLQLVVNMLRTTLWISKTPILMLATSMSTLAWEETSRLLSQHQPVKHLPRSLSLQLALLAPTL